MKLHPYQQKMLRKYGVVALIVLLPVAGFFSGVAYQKSREPNTPEQGFRTATGDGGPMGFGQMHGGGSTFRRSLNMGTVTAISSDSITVKSDRDDTSKTYTITSNTTVRNGRETAKVSDIRVNDTAVVMADTNDSTVAARIMLNPSFPSGPGPGTQSSQDIQVQ